MCAKGVDIGTCFLVGAELKDGKEVFTMERDAFFSMPNEDFAEDMLTKAGAFYIIKGEQIYVVGEDALKFSMVTGNQKDYRRPMAKGVLNPGEEEAISMMEVLLEAVVGKPSYQGEVICATMPANPVDADFDVTFHRMVLERFLKKLGYDVKCINEAMCIIYSENPTVTINNEVLPFTGIAISFGAGMVNFAASWRAKKLLEFSCGRSGDWIDRQVAKVRSVPVSKVQSHKEKYLNFDRIDPTDQIMVALEIYYEDLIRYTIVNIGQQLKAANATIDEPVEIVVAGGTSKPPGFVDRFRALLREIGLPIPVKGVRHAKDPLKAVAAGALIAAISEEKKRKAVAAAGGGEEKAPAPAAGKKGGVPLIS
ncbi:MAG: hypothetical protein FD180_3894 [Planctomycetota bacterium]|nr:MAG: hypothetical protein FD180_3894 [Planctomycetota bacterium]